MENIETAALQLTEAKARYAELLANKTRLKSESERLETLLQATQSEVDACIKERRDFIECGGDVFDPRSKKLRKQEQENAALIDDLKFAIETNDKAAGALLFDLSNAHEKAMGKSRVLVKEMIADLIAKVKENPPVELLMACHLATQVHFEEGYSFFLQELSVFEKTTYENAFKKQMNRLFSNELTELTSSDYRRAMISEEDKALLSVPLLKDKLSPAQAHFIKAIRAGKPACSKYPYEAQETIGGGEIEARSRNLGSI